MDEIEIEVTLEDWNKGYGRNKCAIEVSLNRNGISAVVGFTVVHIKDRGTFKLDNNGCEISKSNTTRGIRPRLPATVRMVVI